MSSEQSDAIVLRTFPWSETSVVASLYTRDFGKISAVAKGARRPKSSFEAALDLLSVSRVVFISKSSDSLDILTEAKLQKRFRAGSQDLLRLYAGYYVAELLDRLTDKGDKQPEIYDIALATLDGLANPEFDVRAIVLRLELQLLRCVGHQMSLRICAHCGQEMPSDDNGLENDNGLKNTESGRQSDKWLIVGLIAGGVLCEKCQPSARWVIRVPKTCRGTLESFSRVTWQDIDMRNYPTDHRAAIRGLIEKYLTVVLDRKLQLHSYLEELGR